MNLDYNVMLTGKPYTDSGEYRLYQNGLLVGTTSWHYVKQFRDYYGVIDCRDVVETWKKENLIGAHNA